MSAIRIYYLFVGCILDYYVDFSIFIIVIYGQIIGNIFELRLFLYLKFLAVAISPYWINVAAYGVLMVE